MVGFFTVKGLPLACLRVDVIALPRMFHSIALNLTSVSHGSDLWRGEVFLSSESRQRNNIAMETKRYIGNQPRSKSYTVHLKYHFPHTKACSITLFIYLFIFLQFQGHKYGLDIF
ncbi:hypothetical protein NQD34_003625 [Periophthalmus magnuspinnatus]|nr:hypothetical protein NQD34_003625 [Periophthalmus magnuspinnatus]